MSTVLTSKDKVSSIHNPEGKVMTQKPKWLRVKLPIGKEYQDVRKIVTEHNA